MEIDVMMIAVAAGCFVVGVLVMNTVRNVLDGKRKNDAQQEAEKIIGKAKKDAHRIQKDADKKTKDIEHKVKRNAEKDIEKLKRSLEQKEKEYSHKEKQLDDKFRSKENSLKDKLSSLSEREERTKVSEKQLSELKEKNEQLARDLTAKLEKTSGMSSEEVKNELVERMRGEAELEAGKLANRIEEEARVNAEMKAKKIISLAISRYSGEYVTERTVSVVELPNEEMKGKIIGREGRNIRALETACGVDLIVDDTPEAVVISGFDPVRRELARRTLEKLIDDGRIHPARIEEILEKEKKELFKTIKSDGEQACFDLGVHGVHQEILKVIGSLKYRTSYTQNNYPHSIEVGFLSGMMAAELGGDVQTARRAGLLHDLGKALDHSIAGSHAVIGADFAKKFGESETVCHAVRAHHEDEKPNTVIAHVVQAADALSSARPGARRQMMEAYINRLEDLESIANSFEGVIRSYALQAGREIRVIVEGRTVNDELAVIMSRDIARKIESELTYPGQIKVTVIREIRAIDHAR